MESFAWKPDYLRYVAQPFLTKKYWWMCISHQKEHSTSVGHSVLLLYFKGSLVTAKHNCPHLAHTKMKAWRKYEHYATEPAGDNKCNANRSNWKENPHSVWNPSIVMGLLYIHQDCSSTLALKFIRHHVCVKVGLTKWKRRLIYMNITKVIYVNSRSS